MGRRVKKLSIMATEACMCDASLVFQKEKKGKTIVDPFLGVTKRAVWAVYPSKRASGNKCVNISGTLHKATRLTVCKQKVSWTKK